MTEDRYYQRLETLFSKLQSGYEPARDCNRIPVDRALVARLNQPALGEADYLAPDVAVRELETGSLGVPVPVRVYTPVDGAGRLPLFVWCHGGGWVGGDLDMPEADATAREVCSRAKAIVVSVGYRLAVNGLRYPAPHDDVVSAFRWAFRQAEQFGADPERAVLGGASAGANLAAGAALRLSLEDGPAPVSLVLAYPVVHPRLPPASEELRARIGRITAGMAFSSEILDPTVENYLGASPDDADEYAMPGLSTRLSRLPPTLIINCEYDGLRASGEEFAKQLAQAGVDVAIRTVANVAHGHLNRPGLPQAQESYGEIAAWVEAGRTAQSEGGRMRLIDLKTNHMVDPLAVDGVPEFSWRIESKRDGLIQRSYRILVTSGDELFWDSNRIEGRQQSFVAYAGRPLASHRDYSWTVEVEDDSGASARSSATFASGFLSPEEWSAKWIESSIPRPDRSEWNHGTRPPAVLFTRLFRLARPVRRARLYATAHGAYLALVNGQRPDDREFAPEHTVYRSILYYQTYDVGAMLEAGANEISFYVGDGWYLCPQTRPIMDGFRDVPAVLFELHVEYDDGTGEVVRSDGSEVCATGPVRSSDIFWGERYDARVPFEVGRPVAVRDHGYDNLLAQPMPPIRPQALLPAIGVSTSPGGDVIVDFGQVIAGRARIRIDAPAGTEAAFEYFETTDRDGNYFNSMIAGQKDVYISDGRPREYEPLFTFHGFRYVRVTGLPEVRPEDFTAVLLTTEKEDRGSFTSSDPRLNRLYRNVRWSQWNNMMSIPTDCPTREKAGFTGDIQIYAPTALLNEDMTPFLSAWLMNLEADQLEDGVVPMTVPFTRLYEQLANRMAVAFGDSRPTGIAGWGDAVLMVPYAMYRATGNRIVLERHFEAMKRWCDYILATARDRRGDLELPADLDARLWNTGFHFGEWLIPSQPSPADDFEICTESAAYVAPYFGAHSLGLLARIARILQAPEAGYYEEQAAAMKDAVQEALLRSGRLPSELMGAYVLAIGLDLVPPDMADTFAKKLVALVEGNGTRLDTGFLATPYLLDALTAIGRKDLAYAVLWQEQAPSWLYQINKGATAIWETWEAIRQDGTPTIESYDHYAFGCVDDWITRTIVGLRIDETRPGYQHAIISPDEDAPVSSFRRTHRCESGTISIARDGDRLEVTLPCNSTATVVWRGRSHEIGSGTHIF